MVLNVGSRLGPYSVTAKIGEGGMGEVYRARDTKLPWDLALKMLPTERMRRFGNSPNLQQDVDGRTRR